MTDSDEFKDNAKMTGKKDGAGKGQAVSGNASYISVRPAPALHMPAPRPSFGLPVAINVKLLPTVVASATAVKPAASEGKKEDDKTGGE